MPRPTHQISCAMPCLSITLVCLALSQHHSRVPCLVSASLSCAMPCLSITLVCLALSQHHSRLRCLVSASITPLLLFKDSYVPCMPFPVVHGSLLNPPHVRKSKLFNEIRVNGSEILDCPMNLSVGGACAQVNTLVCVLLISAIMH